MSHALPDDVLALARAQDGILTRAQLLDAGWTASRVSRRASAWQRVHPGTWFVMPGLDGVVPPRALARAAVLHAGPESRICLGYAAYLHGIDDVPPSVVTVFAPYGSAIRSSPGLVVRRERVGVRLPSTGDLPMTGVEDTVLDLTNEGGPGMCVHWVTRAVQRRLTTPTRLRERLGERHRLRHRQLLVELLADVEEGATTVLEVRALRTVFRPHGLPTGTWQVRVGSLGYVVDALLPGDVVLELDGRRGHVEEGAFRDRRRDNAHAGSGMVTLRFGWAEVAQDPCGVARQILEVLRARGWDGDVVEHRPCAG